MLLNNKIVIEIESQFNIREPTSDKLKMFKKEKEGAEMMELEKYTLGSLKRAVFEGDVETGSLMSGQVAGMVHEERSLKDIIEGLFKEYEEEKKRVMEVHL